MNGKSETAKRVGTEVSLLDSLTKRSREALLEEAEPRRYKTGQPLWNQGDTPKGITLVVSGRVRVVRATKPGRQILIHTAGAGDTLGEVPFFAGEAYPASAIAAQPTECLTMSRASFERLTAANPEIAWGLLKHLALRVKGLVERMDQQSHSVEARLAGYLLKRSETVARTRSTRRSLTAYVHPDCFTLGMTQVMLAEELGTVREVLVRALRRLRDSGAIDSDGYGRYRIANAPLSRRLAAN